MLKANEETTDQKLYLFLVGVLTLQKTLYKKLKNIFLSNGQKKLTKMPIFKPRQAQT